MHVRLAPRMVRKLERTISWSDNGSSLALSVQVRALAGSVELGLRVERSHSEPVQGMLRRTLPREAGVEDPTQLESLVSGSRSVVVVQHASEALTAVDRTTSSQVLPVRVDNPIA